MPLFKERRFELPTTRMELETLPDSSEPYSTRKKPYSTRKNISEVITSTRTDIRTSTGLCLLTLLDNLFRIGFNNNWNFLMELLNT